MKKKAGLTLVEMLIVVSLLAILLGLGTVVFNNFVREDQLKAESKKIVAWLNEAQAKTLAGYSYGGESGLNFGVHFEANGHTLFSGTSYNPNDSRNQKVDLSSSLEISEINFSLGNVIFEKITGEVREFDPNQNFIILSDQQSNREKKISINKLGVVKVE